MRDLLFIHVQLVFIILSHVFMHLFSKMYKNSMFIIESRNLKSVRWIINDLLPRSRAARAFFLGLKLN